MRKETGGTWRLFEVAGDIHEPYIDVDFSKGLYLNPFLEASKVLYEQKRGGLSLAAIVSGEVMSIGLAEKFV
jgi:hypothetical protein